MATINGTNGGDSLYGGAAADVINGLNGNDTLKGFGGADRLDGGNGIDTVFYGDSTAGVGINLATGRGVGGSAQGDTLISIENVFGSNFNDTLTGTSGANQLHGQDGNDVIKGGGGNDFLDGGNGNDILVSSIWDASTLDGGAGDDTFKGSGASDVLIGGSGSDTADFSHMSFVTITLGDPIPYWARRARPGLPAVRRAAGDLLGRLRTSDDRIEYMNANALPRGCGPLLVAELVARGLDGFVQNSVNIRTSSVGFSCRRSNTISMRPTRGRDPRASTRGAWCFAPLANWVRALPERRRASPRWAGRLHWRGGCRRYLRGRSMPRSVLSR